MNPQVAVIGAGGMGRFHAETLAAIPDVDLAEICDPYPSDELEQFGVPVTTDPEACAAVGWDGVVIASPDETHADLTLLALDAGSRVLCEKPLAHEPARSRAVIDRELSIGARRVQVGFMREFDAAHLALAEQLAALGAIHHVRCTHRNANDFVRPPATVLVQSLIHDVHTIRWLAGEVDDVAVRSIPRDGGGLTHVLLTLGLASGASAVVEFSDDTYGYEVEVEVTAEKGLVATAPPPRPRVRVDGVLRTPIGSDWFGWFADAYRAQDRAWVASLAAPAAVGPSPWDAHADELVTAAALARLEGRSPTGLDPGPTPEMYRR